TGEYRYGALNLLAATLHAHSSGPEAADVLVDDSPRTYSINFGGITRNGVEIRSRGLAAADRSPLVSLATSDAADAVTALGALNQAL
ncbi:MAG: hypothetical protein WBO21_02450, partial [Acidimicrobiia bacterium]